MWQTLAIGSVFFPGLFALSVRSLSWIAPAWRLKDRIVLSSRLVSSLQAAMATLSGIIVICNCNDVVHDRHWIAQEYILVIDAYMAYDIYVMYLCYWFKCAEKGATDRKHSLASVKSFLWRERLMVTHHLFIIIVLTPVAVHFRGELGDFFVGCIYTAELSTPFVSLGKILMQVPLLRMTIVLGPPRSDVMARSDIIVMPELLHVYSELQMQDSLLHKVNGILILVTFFLCRILLFPFMYWAYARHTGMPIYKVPFHIPIHCNVTNALLIAPQLYWFVLICRKAARLYSDSVVPDRAR